MTPNPILPTLPQNPSDADLRACAVALLQMILDAGVPALRLQGFTDQDLFELRRLAASYGSGMGTLKDLQSLRQIADKLDANCTDSRIS